MILLQVPPSGFFDQLKTVATSPLALVAYTVLIVTWAFVYLRSNRLKTIATKIKNFPEADRRALLEREYGNPLKEAMTADEFIRDKKLTYLFYGFIALVLMVTIIVVVTLTVNQSKPVNPSIISQNGFSYTIFVRDFAGKKIKIPLDTKLNMKLSTEIKEGTWTSDGTFEFKNILDKFKDSKVELSWLPDSFLFINGTGIDSIKLSGNDATIRVKKIINIIDFPPAPPPEIKRYTFIVDGEVIDKNSLDSLSAVTISSDNLPISAKTDEKGYFIIKIDTTIDKLNNIILRFNKKGYNEYSDRYDFSRRGLVIPLTKKNV